MENEMIWVNEGFVLSDAGHMIVTSYIDLRKPEDRTPIKGLVRGCERKYALEDCGTIMLSKPARYRSYGEELILDVQEGLAKEETVIALQATAAQASRQRSVSDLNQTLELLDSSIGSRIDSPRPTLILTPRASLTVRSGGFSVRRLNRMARNVIAGETHFPAATITCLRSVSQPNSPKLWRTW